MTASILAYSFPYCPTAPNWYLNWEEIVDNFSWLKHLKDCPQDPRYHAEGDVLTHTRLVCEALISLPAWQQLPSKERSLLFAAALLHDVAKPAVTETKEDENEITSIGHVRLGTKMAREILWNMNVPFLEREAIVSLIKLSSLPLWFWDKPSPQKSVIKASYIVNCKWLSILAEADVLGRQCQDQGEILDRVKLFREYCLENDCFDYPRPFASDHSRFIYFQKEEGDPNYAAFDNTRCEVILMCGLPGAGKDSWVKANAGLLPVVSLDQLRLENHVSPEDNQGIITDQARALVKNYLRSGTSFVWNATNVSNRVRSSLIRMFAKYQARVRIVYLEVCWDELWRRNRSRTDQVPEKAILRMANRLDLPNLTEAHKVDYIV